MKYFKSLIALGIFVLLAPLAFAGDWKLGGNTAWVGRSDVNVQVWLTAGSLTGPNIAPPTQMLGPFAAGELRTIASAALDGTGQQVCAHAFAYTGTGNNAGTPVGTSRSVEVSNCQSFQLGPPVLSVAP